MLREEEKFELSLEHQLSDAVAREQRAVPAKRARARSGGSTDIEQQGLTVMVISRVDTNGYVSFTFRHVSSRIATYHIVAYEDIEQQGLGCVVA